MTEISDLQILADIRFGFISDYKVAGMGEPWFDRLGRTFELLKEMQIGAILTLTEDNHYGKYYAQAGFITHHEPIPDYGTPSPEGLTRAVGFIESCVQKDIGVAVHCAEGRGRTGLALAVWLAQKESLNAEDAIRKLYDLRIHTALSPEQRGFICEYLKD